MPLSLELAKSRASSLSVSALLAGAGGFLDGFTYVGHGHVFANAMTGNVVLLGIDSLSGSWQTAFRHLPPIAAFLVGIGSAEAIALFRKRRGMRAPYITVLTLEIGILAILSLLPAATKDIVFTICIAFAASVQVQTFREVNGHSFNSTFTTGNLRTLSESAFKWFFEGRESAVSLEVRDFAVICFAFLLGAISGGAAFQAFGNRALWCEIALLIVVALRIQTGGAGSPEPRHTG